MPTTPRPSGEGRGEGATGPGFPPRGQGYERLRGTIQRYATALGATGKYHETVTRAWSAHVYRALKETPELEPFTAFQEAHPGLRDGKLLERHYREETLEGEAARREWVAPDVSPLPVFP